MSLWPQPMIHAGECHERKQRPLVIVGRDQTATAPGKHLEIFCCAIYPAPSFGATVKAIADIACLDPFGGFNRSDTTDQCGQLRTGWLGHPG